MAKPSGPRVAPAVPSSTMIAVIGATRKPAEDAARTDSGATATASATARDRSFPCGIAKATAPPYTAPHTDPTNRSNAALSEPPTLPWVTIRAVMTAQKPCGRPNADATPNALRLDAVMRSACSTCGRRLDSLRHTSIRHPLGLLNAVGNLTLPGSQRSSNVQRAGATPDA